MGEVVSFFLDGGLVGIGDGVLESGEPLGGVLSSFSSEFGDDFGSLFVSVGFVGLSGFLLDGFGVGVESEEGSVVLEGVLLLHLVEHDVLLGGSHGGLDFVRVDESGKIGIAHHGSLEAESGFLDTGVTESAEHVVQLLEGALRPDDEAAQLTTGGQLKQVKSVHVAHLNSGHVSSGLGNLNVFVSDDDEGSLSEVVSSVSELALTGSEGLGVNDLLHIGEGTVSLQEGDQLLGLLDALDGVLEHEGKLSDAINSVASSLNQGKHGGSGQSSGDGLSLLLDVDSSVPSSPDLEGGEHASLSALVTEGGLAGSVGTGAGNSGNSGNGSTGTPGLGGVLVTLSGVDSVGLSAVLAQVRVHEGNDVLSQR